MTSPRLNYLADITSWQQAYELQMAPSPADVSSFFVSNSNFELLALGRTFYPKPYTVGSVQHVLALPWATEYFVLPYWFFFFSLGLIAIWLVTLYVQTTLHVESRFLRRETRGFSRAQTGDALTSVVPLAWSVSMLMHASVHSFNFDDNTAGAVFSFNVLAYQWGWNYYFPADLLSLFKEGPKRVGHNSVEFFGSGEPYSALLLRFRTEHTRRLALQGEFTSRAMPVLSPLSLFTHAPSPEVIFEPTLFLPAPSHDNSHSSSDNLATTLSQLETTNAPFFSSYAWLSSSPLFRLLGGSSSLSFSWFYPSPATLGSIRDTHAADAAVDRAIFTDPHAFSLVTHLLPTRALPSLSFSGNRFYLIHRHLAAQQPTLMAGFFSSFNDTSLLSSLPRGFFAGEYNAGVVETSNLTSLFALRGDLGAHSDNTGWGFISFEDLGLTNAAASKALVSGGISAGRAHALFLNPAFTSSSAVTSAYPQPFSADLASDWAPAWLLSLRANTQVLGLVNFFLTTTRSTSPLLGAQAYFSGLNSLAALGAGSSISSLLHTQPSWSDLIHSLNSAPHHTFFTFSPSVTVPTGLAFKPFSSSFVALTGIDFLPSICLQLPQTSMSVVLPSPSALTLRSSSSQDLSFSLFTRNSALYPLNSLFRALAPSFFAAAVQPTWLMPLASSSSCAQWLMGTLLPTSALKNLGAASLSSAFQPTQLLSGLDALKPTKSLSPVFDPLDFLGGVGGLEFSPWLNHFELFDWFSSWINQMSWMGAPSYKLWRGAFAGRLASNTLGSFSSPLPSPEPFKGSFLPKNKSNTAAPLLTLVDNGQFFCENAQAVLDKEWALATTLLALDLPNPFEDLDPNFIYRRWTMEVNTTRRTDHSARYQVTSGAFMSAKLHANQTREHSLFSQREPDASAFKPLSASWVSSIGPQGYRSASPRFALSKPTLPLFLTHPDNLLSPLQYQLSSPNLNELLTLTPESTTVAARTPSVASTVICPLGVHTLLGALSFSQKRHCSSLSAKLTREDFSSLFFSRTAHPASVWSFRPSIFPQNMLYLPSTYLSSSNFDLVTLSLFSFYNHTLNLAQNNFDLSSVRSGIWGTGSSHPLLSLLSSAKEKAAASYQFSLRGLVSQLSEGWVLNGGLQKDFYAPIPSDIRAVRRLRASKAVCLPCDIPMHIVCGSKDVIHSWAIPGLCIKIDCIPGFSSHRRLTLRWRGTFWGQCMEVCGRYHHWMPILVQVTHRDLFLSWCLGFLKALEAKTLLPLQPGTNPRQLSGWFAAYEATL